MGLSRWDTIKSKWNDGPPDYSKEIAYHQGYILALKDVLDDLEESGPEESAYPHHVIRFMVGQSLDEAERSLLAVLELQSEHETAEGN